MDTEIEDGNTARTGRAVRRELARPAKRLRTDVPDVIAAQSMMQRAVMTEGALPAKVKELIALAIAATRQCDGCIAAHALGVARHGATEAEVAEAMGVVILMNGGPGTVWGARALDAYRERADDA